MQRTTRELVIEMIRQQLAGHMMGDELRRQGISRAEIAQASRHLMKAIAPMIKDPDAKLDELGEEIRTIWREHSDNFLRERKP